MKLLVSGAGHRQLFSAPLHEPRHDDVSLLAGASAWPPCAGTACSRRGDSPAVRRVPVPVVEHPAAGRPRRLLRRAHQVDEVLESLAGLGPTLFAQLVRPAGALGAVIGRERVCSSFPSVADTIDGDIVDCPADFMTRPIHAGAEPDGMPPRDWNGGAGAPRRRINAKAEPQIDAWLKTQPRSRCHSGRRCSRRRPGSAGRRSGRVRAMIRLIRQNLAAMPTPRSLGGPLR